MSYENEIQHLMRELKSAKSSYLNARLNSEDALMRHALKTDVETIEFQIDVFEKAAKADEYEAKAKAFDAIHEVKIKAVKECDYLISPKFFKMFGMKAFRKLEEIEKELESGEYDAKK